MSDAVKTEPVLFRDMTRPRQGWESVGGALVTGVVGGCLLGFAWWAYALAVLVAFVGGFGAGSQHRTLAGALARGAVGGAVWALGVLLGLAITGRPPTVALPDPQIALLLWGIVPACVVGTISWSVGRRSRLQSA